MGMTVQRRKDSNIPKVFMHKIADIRGGVSIKTSELGGDFLFEGTILSKPEKGISHVVKVAKLTAQTDTGGVTFQVKKGHHFKVGDFVMAEEGAKAYAITEIDKANKTHDVITIGTAIGEVKQHAYIFEAAAQSADTTSKFKYAPFAVAGTGKRIGKDSNLDVDAWLIGVTKGNDFPEAIAKEVKGIINY